MKFNLHQIAALFSILIFCLRPLAAQDSIPAKWTDTGNLLTARTYQTATLLPDGRVLMVGGHGYSSDLSSVELYDPAKDVFTQATDINPGRVSHTATLLPSGQVLVVGGQFNGKTLDDVQLYNPGTGKWTPTGSLHIPRVYHTATLLPSGKVLVVGGSRVASPPVFSQGAPPESALNTAELYDPASGKWSVTDNLHMARYVHAATLLKDGRVLVTGGLGEKGISGTLDSAEIYNPSNGTWTLTGRLRTPRFNPNSNLLPDGKVLVSGGDMPNGTVQTSTEIYDPSTGTWTQADSLHAATGTSISLPNGQVMIIGGFGGGSVLTDTELYDLSSGKWEKTANLNTPCVMETATVLPNGKVLIAGGHNGNGSPDGVMANAELYEMGSPKAESSVLSEIVRPSPSQPGPSISTLFTLTGCLVILTICLVILTACVVILLCVGLIVSLFRRGGK